jgi:hypothetical protein
MVGVVSRDRAGYLRIAGIMLVTIPARFLGIVIILVRLALVVSERFLVLVRLVLLVRLGIDSEKLLVVYLKGALRVIWALLLVLLVLLLRSR